MIEVDFVKKRWIMISTCLFIMISLSAVSASESVENQTFSSDNDAINVLGISSNNIISTSMGDVENESDLLANSLSNDNDVLSEGNGGTFTDLKAFIDGSAANSVITLTGDYVFTSGTDNLDTFKSGITIGKSLTINGNGQVKIDGSGLVRALRITPGNTVTLTGITFVNCYSQATTLNDNNIPGMGGAVFGQGVVHINNCKFLDNTANFANGGAVCLAGYGSTITNSYFEGNKAVKNPGNENSGGAGAVFINANNTTISHSTFIENIAGLNGGAIGSSANHLENVTIINCTISNNTASGSAGGIGMQSSNFYIYNSTLNYNEAKGEFTTYPGNGGALVMRGWDSYAYNCTFIGNIAKQHGGAVFSTNTSYNPLNNNTGFELCNFIDNIAGSNGGAVDWAAGATHGYISDSTFVNNIAKRSGGAVHWSGHYGSVSNSTFKDNNATGEVKSYIGGIYGGGDGGAIVWVGSHGLINGSCNFTNNYAANRGGAIFMHGNSTENCTNITVDHCNFDDNYAGLNGGAVDWNSGSHEGNIYYSTFTNNVANSNGGAVYWSGHNGEILHSNFTNNTAKGKIADSHGNIGDGGAIIWSGLNGTVINCSFIDNNASMRGGAVYLQNCSHGNCTNTTFSYVYFKNNTAGTNGGAIDWHEGAEDGHLLYAVFEQNTAKRSGGAIYWNGKNGEIKHSNFTDNKALGINNATDAFGKITYGGDGGAVIWIGSEGEVDNCTFVDNEAAKRGGAVYLQANGRENCSNTNFTNSYFKNNTAGTNGGAIDWNKGAHNGLVENVTFINNTAKRSGGAVYWNGEYGDIIHANFTGNRALGIANASDAFNVVTYGGDGGAVIWIGSYGSVDDCIFENNSAAKRGGAVYLQGTIDANCTDTNFTNSYFKNNTAGTNGGAIDWNKGAQNGLVYNVTFIDNIAKRSGGAIYWNGHNGTISWSKFYNNSALGLTNATTTDGLVTYGGDGGAIIWSGALGTVEKSNFVNNTAAKCGGAVFLQGSESESCDNTTFKDSYFAHNVAGTNGGAIDWYSESNNGLVDNVIFLNNTAKRNGGAIFWHGNNGTIKNSQFNNNRATGTAFEYTWDITENDVIVYDESHEEFLKTTPTSADLNKIYVINETLSGDRDYFVSYVAVGNETAGYHWEKLDETIISLSESIISPVDWAIDQYFGGDGGTILWSGDIGLVENCTFIESNSARRGGGAYLTGSDNITFDGCYFENCTSGTNGGGVDWLAGANYGKIYNTVFNNTRAARSAGAIYYDGDYGEMRNITIINATSFGGSLKTSRDGLVHYAGWDTSHWDTNTTGGDAGAIMITGDHLYIYNATFTNCTSVGRGGAVFLQDNKNATFELCIFENNYAKGIANNTWANYTQERDDSHEDTKVNYKLTGHGGAVAFDVNAKDSVIINSKFYNNVARRNGGAINFDQGSTNNTIKDSEFINNSDTREQIMPYIAVSFRLSSKSEYIDQKAD